MSDKDQSAFYESITDVLKKYDTFKNKQNVNSFVLEQLAKAGGYSDQEQKYVLEEISNTIDMLDESFSSLQEFKVNGGSRAAWLKNNIEKIIFKLPDDEKSVIMKEMKTALFNANDEIYKALYQQQLPEGFSQIIKNFRMSDVNAVAVIQGVDKDIQTNSILNAITQSGVQALPIFKEQFEIPTIKQYFESKLDSPDDKNIKKVVAFAAEMAKKKGFKPLLGKAPAEIAMIVDRGVSTAKLAYKVANREVSAVDAADYMIDRTASTVNVAVIKTCQKVGLNVGAAIGGTLGSIFGPTGTVVGTTVGRVVGYVAGTVVGTVITKGVEIISDAAKSVVRSACSGISSVSRSAVNFISSFW